jgi:hypothetical protein
MIEGVNGQLRNEYTYDTKFIHDSGLNPKTLPSKSLEVGGFLP